MSSEKIEAFWQDATADDVARVMAGETVEARFRDSEKAQWFISGLAGWTAGMIQWYSTDDDFWEQCQVYREPSWYAKRPDPGPEWRLLEKFPPEAKLGTDDYWSILGEEWRPVGSGDNDQHEQVWYRRRIEPVEPEPAIALPIVPKHLIAMKGDVVQHLNGLTLRATEKGFEVTQ